MYWKPFITNLQENLSIYKQVGTWPKCYIFIVNKKMFPWNTDAPVGRCMDGLMIILFMVICIKFHHYTTSNWLEPCLNQKFNLIKMTSKCDLDFWRIVMVLYATHLHIIVNIFTKFHENTTIWPRLGIYIYHKILTFDL